MHIAVVTRNLSAGGAERVIAQLLAEWCKSGIKCSLILLNQDPIFYKIPDCVMLYKIGKLSANHYIDKLKKYLVVRDIIKRISPHVVLSMPEEIGIYVIGALLTTRTPVIVSERNNPWVMPNKKVTRILRKLLYPFADGIIFQTNQAASFFSESIQKKGIVLPNPLDLSRIPEPFTGQREKVIVSAGRLEPQKNFSLLISAFKNFYQHNQGYRLIIYGEGRLRRQLEEEIVETGLPTGTIALPGHAQDLLERMRTASAFVLTSDYEGVPNALIEAMAMGVPCISTDCPPGGPAQLIKHNENGFLVPVNNKKDLVKSLNILINNSDLQTKFSSESIKVKTKLDANIIGKEWINYLEKKCYE
jgi:glycosyltransferase involved in cell wall biosynthesis